MPTDPLLGFVTATALLLALPGPTNALLMTAGAARPAAGTWRLLAAELLAYGLAIGPLLAFGELLGAWRDLGGMALKTIAVAIILWLAIRMWVRAGRKGETAIVSPGAVFWVTLFNPKSLVFAFAVFPPVGSSVDLGAKVGLFALVAALAGLAWLQLGALHASRGPKRADLVGRLSAVILCGFAVYLGSSVMAAAATWLRLG